MDCQACEKRNGSMLLKELTQETPNQAALDDQSTAFTLLTQIHKKDGHFLHLEYLPFLSVIFFPL